MTRFGRITAMPRRASLPPITAHGEDRLREMMLADAAKMPRPAPTTCGHNRGTGRGTSPIATQRRADVLACVETHGPLTIFEVADRLGVTYGLAEYSMTQLASEGLVERAGFRSRRQLWRVTA